MIQTSNARFLSRLLTLWMLLLAVTAEESTYYGSAASPPPSFLRRGLQQKCNNNVCPTIEPTPGGSCCYTGTSGCNYDYVYLWDSTCENISCIPVMTCECSPDPTNRKKRAWNCAMKRRALAAIECPVTDVTSSVGMPCTPAP
jgi:hypothetical protein